MIEYSRLKMPVITESALPPRPSSLLRLAMLVIAGILLMVLIQEPVRNTSSDPRATLLVSQALLQHGTIKLDHYGSEVLNQYGYVIAQKNGHAYYYFPLGTSLLSVPVVAVANGLGFDMLTHEPIVQMAIVAMIALAMLFLLYALARLFLSPWPSLGLATLCWFGTSLASMVGTALWSHDFATLLAAGALYLVLSKVRRNTQIPAYALAACLILAYLCRPTMALLAPFLLLYLFVYDKPSALKSGVWLVFFLLCFILWSQHEFSQPLPDYYLPKRLEGGDFLTALYGNLLSPARGLLIFSPFLLPPILMALFLAFRNKHFALILLIGLAWPTAHLLFISRFPHWWAGWSFGSRFMTDALPGLFILLFYSLSELRMGKATAFFLIGISGAFSIFVNSYQGLFNPYTAQWNAAPNVDQHPEYLFDWRYPQFLHNAERHQKRLEEFQPPTSLTQLEHGFEVKHDAQEALFIGWSDPEQLHRWSAGKEAKIRFALNKGDVSKGIIVLKGGILDRQQVKITLNGEEIYAGTLSGWQIELEAPFDPSLLNDRMNTLEFFLPDAHQPGNGDPRVLGLALRSLYIL